MRDTYTRKTSTGVHCEEGLDANTIVGSVNGKVRGDFLHRTLLLSQSAESLEEFLHITTMATPLMGDVKIVQGSSMGDIRGV